MGTVNEFRDEAGDVTLHWPKFGRTRGTVAEVMKLVGLPGSNSCRHPTIKELRAVKVVDGDMYINVYYK